MNDVTKLKKTFEKRNFYTTKDTGNIFLYALIIPFLVGLVFSYLSMAIVQELGFEFEEGANVTSVMFDNFLWFAIISMTITEVVFICLFFGYHKVSRIKISACNLSFKKANVWTCVLSALTGIICVSGFLLLVEGCFIKMFDVMGLESSSNMLPFDNVGWYFLNLILLGVVPAICEELIFRGVIYQGLKENFSPVARILLTGLLFALMHQNIMQFIYPFILGCVLSVVMEKTNNLLYPILIHMFNNFTTLTFYYFLQNTKFNVNWWFILLAIALAGVTCLILWILYKFYLKKQKPVEVEKSGELTQTPPTMVGKFPLTLVFGIILALAIIIINIIG